MNDIEQWKDVFESALSSLLHNWSIWLGDDELRAIHIGFDSGNTEISVSLLTDREPYLDEEGIGPFGARWPTADWRLSCISRTYRHCFPDAAEVLEWMENNAKTLDHDHLLAFNNAVKRMLFESATGDQAQKAICRFRHTSKSIRIRVEWFFDSSPLDTLIEPS